MNEYMTKAFEAAKAQHLTAADVAALDYDKIARLAGLTLGPKGESPADFEYRPIRRKMCAMLVTKDRNDTLSIIKSAAENAVKLLPGLSDAKITVDEDGRLCITSSKVTSDAKHGDFANTVHDWLETQGVNR